MRPNLPSTSTQGNPDLVNPTAAVARADGRMVPVAGQVPAPGAAGSESGPDQAELDANEQETAVLAYAAYAAVPLVLAR